MSSPLGRAFLSLPAVEPRGTVAPAPLLHALLALLREISSASLAPVHRAPARSAVRLAAFLLPTLESFLPSPEAVPALLELYLSSQRLRLLLHDLSRRGTRLLSLLLRDRLAAELRAISQGLALGLDALPLPAGDEDAAETLRLAAVQARRKDRNHPDPADDRAAEIARSTLDGLARGLPPDCVHLRELLDHLGIQSWSACNDEVSFLEDELKLSGGGERKRDTSRREALVGSLLGLALYSRSACCDAPDLPVLRTALPDPQASAFDCLNPEEFRCPISMDLMTDPVTVATGQTYNRSSILRWFKAGNLTCPVTGEKLARTDVVPNLAVGSVIRRYCRSKRVALPEAPARGTDRNMPAQPPGEAAAHALRMLAGLLVERLKEGGNASRAVHEVRLLARLGHFHRECLADAGAAPCLVHLLGSRHPQEQEHAMAAVLNLSKHPAGRRAVVDAGGLVHVLEVLAGGLSADARQNAAATLFYLSSEEDYRAAIGEAPGAVESLVELLGPSGVSTRSKRNAAAALLGILGHAGNRRRVVSAGAVPVLAGIVSPAEREDVVLDGLAVLAVLAECREGAAEILRTPAAVRGMAELLRTSTSQAVKEWCVSILLCLCNHGGVVAVGCLGGLPTLMPSLYSQLTEGSQRASKKASSLIGILHRSAESRAALPRVRAEVVAPLRRENVEVNF